MNRDTVNIVVGLVLIAVAFIIFPIVLTGAGTILTWTASDNTTISVFTGLDTMVKIAPTLAFLSLLFGGGFLTFQGIKGYRGEGGGRAGRSYH